VPRLYELYPGICLATEEKARKTLSQGSRRLPVGKEYTEQKVIIIINMNINNSPKLKVHIAGYSEVKQH
jgi:hypothetical protein